MNLPAKPEPSEQRSVCKSDAWLASPLANQRFLPTAMSELVHHQRLSPLNGSDLHGSARLVRSGNELHVSVSANHAVQVHLKRCPSAASDDPIGERERPGSAGLFVLLVTKTVGSTEAREGHACFDLARLDDDEAIAEADLAQLSAADLSALDPTSIDLPTAGSKLDPRAPLPARVEVPEPQVAPLLPLVQIFTQAKAVADQAYFERRMREELGAALRAERAGPASRHVQIATLMARYLQSSIASAGLQT